MQSRTIQSNGVSLFTESEGDPSHPAILLLMGACASGLWWPEAFCRSLAERGRWVIRFDQRDTGRSTKGQPGRIDYSLEDLADDAMHILDAYGIRQAHLIGMSLGGFLSQLLALKYPDRVLTLTLIASAPLAPREADLPPIEPRIAAHHARGRTLDWSDRERAIAYAVEAWRLLAGSAHPFDEAKLRSLATEDLERTGDMRLPLNHTLLTGGERWYGRLGEIQAPALVIHGTEDPMLHYRRALSLVRALPGARLLPLEGSGHELHRDDWETILSAIVEHTGSQSAHPKDPSPSGGAPDPAAARTPMTSAATTEQLLEAASRHGLRLKAEAELDSSGADFVVARAVDEQGGRWIVRVPRRPDVVERAMRERRALELVGPRLPVAVPQWRVCSAEVIAYPLLPGEPAAVVDLEAGGYVWRFDDKAPPAAFLESLAAAMAALHAIDLELARAAGLPVRTPAEVRVAMRAKAEGALSVLQVPVSVRRRWQSWLDEDSFWPQRAALVHGDLHPPHLLVGADHRVVGLLDWTEAQGGDPATDFALIYATLGPKVLGVLLDRYRASGGTVWPRMQAHVAETWSAYPVVLADFARLSGEEGPRQLAQMLVEANARELAGGR